MYALMILLLISFLPKHVASATLKEECAPSLHTLFAEKISKEDAGEFLKIQGDITLNRLAWAYLNSQKNDKDEKIQSVERTILELLNDKYTHSDPDFIKARDAFEAQPLSRTTLADIAPYLKEALSNDYEDKDSNFILNNSDLKLLAAIAKQERASAVDGIYSHKMLNSNSANGMLNFIKLINSGYKTNLSEEEKDLQIETKLSGLENIMISMEDKLSKFLDKIELPAACLNDDDCNTDMNLSELFKANGEIQDIFWKSLSDKLLSDDILKENLSYGDLWLKVGTKDKINLPTFVKPPIVRNNHSGEPKTAYKTNVASRYYAPKSSQKIAGIIVDDPLKIIVDDKKGRSYEAWKKFGKDFQDAMAAAIIENEKVFFYKGQLHDRDTGKYISLEGAISKLRDSQQKILRHSLARIGIHNKLALPLVEAWVNNKDTFTHEGKLYNHYGTEIDPLKVILTVVKDKSNQTLSLEALKKLGNYYVVQRANALRNNQPYFKHGNQLLDSYSGRNVSSPFRPISTTDIKLEKSRRKIYEKLSDAEVIKNFNRESIDKTCGFYGIIDKKNAMIGIYNHQGDEVYSSEILIGAEKSDQRTRWTEYSQSKRVSNSSTGAGIFTVKPQDTKDSFNQKHFNNNILSFNNEAHTNAVFAIHQVPNGLESRNARFGTHNPDDRRISGGCANLKLVDLNAIKKWLGNSCKLYVLPEEKGNKFMVKDGALKLVSTENIDMNKNRYYNFSPTTYSPLPIDIKIINSDGDTEVARTYIKALEDEKKKLMELYKISNDEYNELAVLAYGILGNESSFGKSGRLAFKEDNQDLITSVRFLKSFIDQTSLAEAFNTSRGYTQLKLVPGGQFSKFYPEIVKSNLMSPRNSAIATMGFLVLASQWMRNIAIENKKDPRKIQITKESMIDFMGYLYQGGAGKVLTTDKSKQATPRLNAYFRALKKHMSYIEVTQKFE